MASISVVLRPPKGRSREHPLYLRVSAAGRERFISLGIAVLPRDWNAAKQEVRRSRADYKKLNRHVHRIQARAAEVLTDLTTQHRKVTADRIRDVIRRELDSGEVEEVSRDSFLAFAYDVVEQFRRRGQIGTSNAYRTAVNKFRAYARKRHSLSDVLFTDLSPAFVAGFHTYLIEVHGNRPNTCHKNVTTIRTLLYRAIKAGLFPQSKNPFFHIEVRKERATKERLSFEEIQQIEALELKPDSLVWHVRNWFLFAFYAGGLRVSDVCLLKWNHVLKQGDRWRLSFRMKKVNEQHSVLLIPAARSILSHYEHRAGKEARVFPILDRAKTATAGELHSSISAKTALMNKYLRKIRESAGIETHISTHIARHSVADYLRKRGFSVYDISKILGHANVRITETYLRSFDADDLDDKFESAF